MDTEVVYFITTKMRFPAFLIIITLLTISSSVLRNKLPPVVTNCPLLPVIKYSQTIFFDMDEHTHSELKTCILQNSLSDQSVVLLDLHDTDIDIRVNVIRNITTNDNPNVIIMTKYLTPKMVDSPLWQFFINSNWCFLYIIVTSGSKFKCKNGTMNMNDFLLLEDIMNTLWNRFQIMRVGVTFPFACEQKMVIYNAKRPSAQILYDRSIQLINANNSKDLFVAIKNSGEKLIDGYPIRGGIFYRYPTSIKDCEDLDYYVNFNLNLTLGYCGLDGMIMYDILTYLKFNVTFSEDENCNNYGYPLLGNASSGALGCIIRNELDVSFNSRFLTQYSEEHVNYLYYITTDKLCALIKKPDVIPLWQGVLNLISPLFWALITVVVVIIGVIMWATAMINKSLTGLETMTFWYYLQNSATATILGYSPMKRRTFLMIRTTCLLGSIFFAAIYQGLTSRVYTTVERYQQIKTLEELYSSGATLYTSDSMKAFMKKFQNPKDKLETEFFDRAQVMSGDRFEVVMQRPHAATVNRKSDAVMEILERYSDDSGTPLIDILDQCFYTYYLSSIARSGFPFLEHLQLFIERLNEAGLPAMYYRWTQEMLDIPNSIPKNDREPRPFFKIRLEDQRVAFGVLFIGIIVSLIMFTAEIWKGRRHLLK